MEQTHGVKYRLDSNDLLVQSKVINKETMPATTEARSSTRPRRHSLPGPPLEQSFRVLDGMVIVMLQSSNTVIIPAGGGWPGLSQLPEPVRAHMKPNGSVVTPGTVWKSGLPNRDLPAAQALVLAQALTTVGFISERLHLAEQVGLHWKEMSRETAAGLMGTCREYITTTLSSQRKH